MFSKFNKLKKIRKIEQRSDEWYEMRNNILTASDVASVIGENPYSNYEDVIQKKINPKDNIIKNNAVNWGTKYEPIACQIYEQIVNDNVHDFGLIIHEKYDWLGASPDGIRKNGIMLEIKCPYRRIIKNSIPRYIWIQIQIQMEVCNLDMCHLFQCKFIEYENKDEYECDMTEKRNGYCKDTETYWKLEKYLLTEIKRDKEWFTQNVGILESFITELRERQICQSRIMTRSRAKIKSKSESKKRKRDDNDVNKSKKIKTCCKNDKEIVKIAEDDFIISIDKLKNYMNNDKIVDYLEMYHNKNQSNNSFNKYIKKRCIEYEDYIIDEINKKCKVTSITNNKYIKNDLKIVKQLNEDTINNMRMGNPIIHNAVLYDYKHQIYCVIDLLVRIDYINEINENIDVDIDVNNGDNTNMNIGESKIGWNYRMVIIKFGKIKLKSNNIVKYNREISIVKYKYNFCNQLLSEIHGYDVDNCFVIARKYEYDKKSKKQEFGHNLDTMGIIETICDSKSKSKFKSKSESKTSNKVSTIDNKVIDNKVIDGVNWFKDLVKNGNNWDIKDICKYPNMNNNTSISSEFKKIKHDFAIKNKELTLLPYIGHREKELLHKNGVYDWKNFDISSLTGIVNKNRAQIIKNTIDVNIGKKMIPMVKANMKIDIKHVSERLNFYVDFETVNDLNNEFHDNSFNGMINVIGVGYNEPKTNEWIFKTFIANDLTSNSEINMIYEWKKYMESVCKKYKIRYTPYIIHWSPAELIHFRKAIQTYKKANIGRKRNKKEQYIHKELIKYVPNWLDLMKICKDVQLYIKGAFSYGLKDIGNALYKNGYIETKWHKEDNMDGISSMLCAWNGIGMNRVIKYNEVDCKMMWDIVKYINNNM